MLQCKIFYCEVLRVLYCHSSQCSLRPRAVLQYRSQGYSAQDCRSTHQPAAPPAVQPVLWCTGSPAAASCSLRHTSEEPTVAAPDIPVFLGAGELFLHSMQTSKHLTHAEQDEWWQELRAPLMARMTDLSMPLHTLACIVATCIMLCQSREIRQNEAAVEACLKRPRIL